MTKLCFIDTETTSLDDRTGEIWEVALIVRTERNEIGDVDDKEYLWQLPVYHLELADPMSLKINNFHARRWPELNDLGADYVDRTNVGVITVRVMAGNPDPDPQVVSITLPHWEMGKWAAQFVKLTQGAHLIGNVTSFDEERLRRLIRSHGQTQMWHYHLICVENLIAGRLGIQPPWKSKELSEAIGVPVPEDQHGALPDTKWARDMYDAVFHDAEVARQKGHLRSFEIKS